MSDFHSRILFAIDELASCRGREEWFCALGDEPTLRGALRAAVELHRPEQHYTVDQKNRSHPSRLYCRTCRATAPCSTIRVIADALGVKDEELIEKEQHDG